MKKTLIILIAIGLLWTKNTIITIPKKQIKKYIPHFLIVEKDNSQKIGTLIIKKINLKEDLYPINSTENTIEKHITILKETIFPTQENSIVFLAAHSGTGKIAYFEKLDELQEQDEIILIYKQKKYHYQVKDIWEEKKNGYINVNKDNQDQLILTTCHPTKNNYQLIINCIKKESIS